MSSVSKTVEINLNAEERELLEKAITKCKEIAHQCSIEGIFAYGGSVFECLEQDYDSNGGKLSTYVDIEE
jgi:hypothetical protein